MSRFRKPFFAVLASLVGLGIALLGLEIGLRFLLFSESGIARRLGAPWRKAEWYADPQYEDAYWKLQYLFADPKKRYDHPFRPDLECGWTGDIDPSTWMPVPPVDLRGRRPVLLYGDSFANCNTPPGQCFEDLLERSALADRYCLVNYGVGGYGIDQEYLLLQRSIDKWKELDPIVVVSFLVDDDFPRNLVSFRAWPKPRFRIEEDRLVPEPLTVLDPKEFIAENSIGIRSYIGRFLLFRRGAMPWGLQERLRAGLDRRPEAIALGKKILEGIHAELEARGLRHFFLVFHGWDGLLPTPTATWAEELVAETAQRLGVPAIGTRPYLLAAADGSYELAQSRFIGGTERTFAHYNEIGNIIAFEALRQGIEGRFDEVDASRVAGILHRFPYDDPSNLDLPKILDCPSSSKGSDPTGLVRWAKTPYPPFDRTVKKEYLLLRPGTSGPALARLALPERKLHLRGKAIAVDGRKSGTAAVPLVLTIRLDGRQAFRSEVPAWPAGLDVDVDLSGSRELEIAAERSGTAGGEAWIHLADPRLE